MYPQFSSAEITPSPFALASGLIVTLLLIGLGLSASRKREPITFASGVALYIQFATSLALIMAAGGVTLLLKVIMGFMNMQWSYSEGSHAAGFSGFMPTLPSTNSSDLRTQELILAFVLIIVAGAVYFFHQNLVKKWGSAFSSESMWTSAMTPIIATTFTAIVGLFSLGAGLYTIFTNLFANGSAPFGAELALGLVFTGLWLYWLMQFVNRFRPTAPAE